MNPTDEYDVLLGATSYRVSRMKPWTEAGYSMYPNRLHAESQQLWTVGAEATHLCIRPSYDVNLLLRHTQERCLSGSFGPCMDPSRSTMYHQGAQLHFIRCRQPCGCPHHLPSLVRVGGLGV